MKRRTKLTPFAKIVILGLIFLGARYIYLHKNEIAGMNFFQQKDTVPSDVIPDSVMQEDVSETYIIKDTIDLYITKNDSSLRIQTSDTIVEINKKDTLIYTLSEKDNIIGRIILN
ncbi:MAG: hypothetical protein L3J35_08460 [Bacteroidales bacterium]|nr:hypothetical protein [Bacteroidales bacterium]